MSSMSEVDQLILMTRGLKLHPLEEYIGVRFEILDSEGICAKFAMREDLCGYPGGGVIHGGVIAAVMDNYLDSVKGCRRSTPSRTSEKAKKYWNH